MAATAFGSIPSDVSLRSATSFSIASTCLQSHPASKTYRRVRPGVSSKYQILPKSDQPGNKTTKEASFPRIFQQTARPFRLAHNLFTPEMVCDRRDLLVSQFERNGP